MNNKEDGDWNSIYRKQSQLIEVIKSWGNKDKTEACSECMYFGNNRETSTQHGVTLGFT